MASFYERISKNEIKIPDRFDMRYSQFLSLVGNAPNPSEMVIAAFKFGYMQGLRAEKAGKAGITV